MRFCPECGKELTGSKFCGECGYNLSNSNSSIPSKIEKEVTIDAPNPVKNILSKTRILGWKIYTAMFLSILLIHAIVITSGVPSYLWIVSLDTAANIAIIEYIVSFLGTVFFVMMLITGFGSKKIVSGSSMKRPISRDM